MLVDIFGHVKIADFGLSRINFDRNALSQTFCGSPEYMSPEMLQGPAHGLLVDFYSLGALLFELVTGLPPFYSENR